MIQLSKFRAKFDKKSSSYTNFQERQNYRNGRYTGGALKKVEKVQNEVTMPENVFLFIKNLLCLNDNNKYTRLQYVYWMMSDQQVISV